METTHPVFGTLAPDDLDRLTAAKTIRFAGRDTAVTISFQDEEIPEAYSRTYAALTENLDSIAAEILRAIREYQHKHHHDSGHTASFPRFETDADVLAHTALFELALCGELPGVAARPEDGGEPGRYAVLLFSADWVGDDYRVLSVALANERVVCVTDQSILE